MEIYAYNVYQIMENDPIQYMQTFLKTIVTVV